MAASHFSGQFLIKPDSFILAINPVCGSCRPGSTTPKLFQTGIYPKTCSNGPIKLCNLLKNYIQPSNCSFKKIEDGGVVVGQPDREVAVFVL